MSAWVCVFLGVCVWCRAGTKLNELQDTTYLSPLMNYDLRLFQVDDGELECQCEAVQASAEWEETLKVTSEHPRLI